MTLSLLSRIRTLPAPYPSARLLDRSERAYWLVVELLRGRLIYQMIARASCT